MNSVENVLSPGKPEKSKCIQVVEGAANSCSTNVYCKLGAKPCTWQNLADFPDLDTETETGGQGHKHVDKDKDMDTDTDMDTD